MNKLNNKSGFTLIEIIVVLIIVGILAAIALPNLFSNVQKSKAAEALSLASAFHTQLEACAQANLTSACVPSFSNGAGTASTVGGVQDPGSPNVQFSVSNTTFSPISALAYTIKAASAQDGNQYITMARVPGGAVTCTGYGLWAGAC